MMLRRTAALTAVVPTALLLAAATGASAATGAVAATPNGESAKPAKTVLADASRALKAARSVTVDARIPDGKQTIHLHISYLKGRGFTGSFSEGSATASLIEIGKTFYFKGNSAIYGGSRGSSSTWYRFSTSSTPGKDFGELSLSNLADFTPDGTATVSSGRLDGKPVAVVHDSKGGDLDVSGTGTPLPLKLTGTRTDPGSGTFTGYGAHVTLQAPAHSTPIG